MSKIHPNDPAAEPSRSGRGISASSARGWGEEVERCLGRLVCYLVLYYLLLTIYRPAFPGPFIYDDIPKHCREPGPAPARCDLAPVLEPRHFDAVRPAAGHGSGLACELQIGRAVPGIIFGMQQIIERRFRSQFPGLKPEPFTFRIFTREEFAAELVFDPANFVIPLT